MILIGRNVQPRRVLSVLLYQLVSRSGGTPTKVGWGCADHLPKIFPYLWPKSAIFAILFMTWPKIRYPIHDRCGWPSSSEHKLWRDFVDGFIDNCEKVASSKKHMQFKTRVLEPYPIWDQSGQNRYPIYDPNGWKTLPFGAWHTDTYIAHIREYPHQRVSHNVIFSVLHFHTERPCDQPACSQYSDKFL